MTTTQYALAIGLPAAYAVTAWVTAALTYYGLTGKASPRTGGYHHSDERACQMVGSMILGIFWPISFGVALSVYRKGRK